jgi:pimeloyl-ACP methyl ester carboxylesterase
MKQHYLCTKRQLVTDQQLVTYRLYRNKYQPSGRCLLLLHGAGVAGEQTWQHLLTYLSHWTDILVPDLRGMGETIFPDGIERPFRVEEALEDVEALLNDLDWRSFDLGGYSLGGLLSLLLKSRQPESVHKLFLLESALLDHADIDAVIRQRDRYSVAAELIRVNSNPAEGIRLFLDTISPNRTVVPGAEQMVIERLAFRAFGFSYALDAVTEAARQLNRDALLSRQPHVSSFIGGRSVEAMHLYHQQLVNQCEDWCYHRVRGADHSLPYQKPRHIARQMNRDLEQFLLLK